MFDEILEGCPIEKWKEIVLHANPSVVQKELGRLLEALATYELQSQNLELNPQNLKTMKQNLAIESMGNILSENE